jgi:hypothetical protein
VVMSPSLSLPPQSSRCSLDRGDNVVVPLGGGHGDHLGQVLGVVAGDGEDELGYLLLAPPGLRDPGANWFCQDCREFSSTNLLMVLLPC